MVKRLFEMLLIFLLPTLLIVAIYRYCVGFNPLNVRATFELIGNSFTDTKYKFSEIVNNLSSIYRDAQYLSSISFQFDIGVTWLDNTLNGILELLYGSVVFYTYIFDTIILSLEFVLALLGDFVQAVVALNYFFIDSSPYIIQPYFPVG